MTGRRGASLPAVFPSRISRRPFTLIAIVDGLDVGGSVRDKLSLFVGFTAACGKQDGASTVPRADSGAMAELCYDFGHSPGSLGVRCHDA